MRVFTISDLHVDYQPNAHWISQLSVHDYRDDVLIVAGDITDSLRLLRWCLEELVRRFHTVLFVPGNHELWVVREPGLSSWQKFELVCATARDCGVRMSAFFTDRLAIFPLLSWYDYSFGEPTEELQEMWMDFHACRWSSGDDVASVSRTLSDMNEPLTVAANKTVISFSHFMPRVDVMPAGVPRATQVLYPVFGSRRIEQQLRRLGSRMHIYGHSHLNRRVDIEQVCYLNNAFGYPSEGAIARKQLLCISGA